MVVEMVDCPKEFALGKNDVLELIDKMFVKSPEPIENVHATAAITYTLNPGKTADFTIPTTDNQKATRDAGRQSRSGGPAGGGPRRAARSPTKGAIRS